MKHIIMRNGVYIKTNTLHEGVNKICTITISNYQILEISYRGVRTGLADPATAGPKFPVPVKRAQPQ